ncbi:AP-5 complex subunit zeta-1 isoform X1 [Aquila chrysaetos chrysaetos]|uniref:Adaptor related protein complex 5 subunit zeta 1 n=1 Tax=Aquila chrysaetos chrysaetos TaxID=223781 RepID=A0A663F5D6_AQUCH|nr:AP-5 complex subunit zeta-1 isoform X1 [Aquila chrysaetos chrysaetos]
MFTAAAESFLKQAREIQEEELQRFASRVAAVLQGPELGPEAADCLQRLHLTVAATKYPRKLDGKFVELLQTLLCSSKCPEQIQMLCAAILREMSPCNDLILSCDEIQDTKLLSLVSSVLLAQGNKKAEVSAVGQRIVKVLERRLPEGQSARYLLPVLSNVISLSPESLTEEQTNVVSKKMADWLRYASIHQGVAQPSGGFFSNPRTRQPGPVTEVDGAIATDFFTVLSVGQYYTQDQWLNVQAFSMLRNWLLCYGGKTPNSEDKSGMDRSVMSMVSATSTSSRLLPPKERLREKAFEYCQRLIEQSNRRPLKKDDGDLQKACLIEAVTIMDIICKQDSSYVYRAVSFLKILHGRICGDATYARALLPIAQFFLNHSKTATVDSDAIYKHLLTDIPAQLFHNPSLAFEFVQFCKDNSQLFTETSSIFRQSFPNLFKFLAWNSPPLISEFVDLLPFLLDAGTAIEIFHLLLDLPCLTAALDIQLRSGALPTSERAASDPAVKPATCLEAFRHPLYKSMFQYLLRTKSAPEDAPERLIPLRQLLGSMASSPRVVQCAETVPVLLELFFTVVAEFADGPLINQLVVLLLHRSDQLYEIPAFKDDVYRVLSSQLVMLCKLRPALVVELSTEILEFSGTVSNIQNKEAIFTHMVWAIGEYMSVSYDKRCTVEQINRFFETLEAVLFEITQLRPLASTPSYAPRAISVLMATLTKLAARSQDLIPRVSMFLSKMRTFVQSPAVTSVYCEEDLEEILIRATELMNLLKMPSVAQFVFTPPVDVASTRFQRDVNDSLPFALRIVTRLLEPTPGFMPG